MRSLGIESLARADLFVENRNRGWRSTIAPADSHRRVHPMFNCLLQATHSDPRLTWPHPIPPSQRARFLGTLVVAHAVAGVPIRSPAMFVRAGLGRGFADTMKGWELDRLHVEPGLWRGHLGDAT